MRGPRDSARERAAPGSPAPPRPGPAPGTPAAAVVSPDDANTHFPHPLPTEAAEPAAAARAMGNIQRKMTGRGEAGKRPEKGAPRRGRTPGPGADQRGRPRTPTPAGRANGHPGGGKGARDPVAADASPAPGAPPPAPAAPAGPSGLKSQGNELFQTGQFAEAALKYSAAIAQLEPAGR